MPTPVVVRIAIRVYVVTTACQIAEEACSKAVGLFYRGDSSRFFTERPESARDAAIREKAAINHRVPERQEADDLD
jgi:hypothetical protein